MKTSLAHHSDTHFYREWVPYLDEIDKLMAHEYLKYWKIFLLKKLSSGSRVISEQIFDQLPWKILPGRLAMELEIADSPQTENLGISNED